MNTLVAGGGAPPPAVEHVDTPPARAKLTPRDFARFSDYITRSLGIKMPASKLPMLQGRLERRLRRLDVDLAEYQSLLFEDSPQAEAERVHFFDAVTTNKTDFFREPKHFAHLVRAALPALDDAAGRPGGWDFRLWCAGCSTGEEPYTLAMVLTEYAERRRGFRWSILATDISSRVLEHARLGIYGEDRIAPVSADLRRKYLRRGRGEWDGTVRVAAGLRERLRFARLNFMEDAYPIRTVFDVIFFRNVMIYFDKPTQERVVNRLCRHLRPQGYLYVGHAESLAGTRVPLRQVGVAVYQEAR